MTTLKIGIASYEEMKARTLALARGQHRVAASEPEGLVHLERILRQGTVGRQSRTAAYYCREGA
jgi:predicted transcriptional regulator